MSLANLANVQLAEIQVNLENLWAQPQKAKNYTPRVDSLKTALEQQTTVLQEVEDPEKEYDMKLKWVDHAIPTPVAMTQNDDCSNAAGSEGSGKTQSIALDYKKSATVSVELDQLEKSVIGYNEMAATAMAAAIKGLLEDFNATIVPAIDTNRGGVATNYVTGATGWTADTVNKEIEIATANFTATQMIPQLIKLKRIARLSDGFLFDGGLSFNEYYTGLKSVPNADGKLVNEMYRDLPYRHDIDGFATAGFNSFAYLIDPGTIAIANRAKYKPLNQASWTHASNGNYLRYSMPISIADLPQMSFVRQGNLIKQSLMADVQYSIVCNGSNKELATWKIMLRAGTFFNPVRLQATNTGIIRLNKV